MQPLEYYDQDELAVERKERIFDTDQFGPQLRGVVAVSEAPVLAQAPAVQLAAGGDGGAVGAAAGDVADAFGLQGLDEPRFVTVPKSGKGNWLSFEGELIRHRPVSQNRREASTHILLKCPSLPSSPSPQEKTLPSTVRAIA